MRDAYADDDPDGPVELDPTAAPGVRPLPVPGPDTVELVVDGETWLVTHRVGSRLTEFDWASHPHGYGFGTRVNVEREATQDELIEHIRSFMAEVDPATGYLPD